MEKHHTAAAAEQVLARILPKAPHTRCTQISDGGAQFALHSKDVEVVRQVLNVLQGAKDAGEILNYDVHGASLEDIFVSLMGRDSQLAEGLVNEKVSHQPARDEVDSQEAPAKLEDPTPLELSDGRRTWFFQQAGTVFWKRLLIVRRAWLGPVLAMAIACSGACIPLFFMKDRVKTCVPDFSPAFAQPLLFPWSVAVNGGFDPESSGTAIIAPPTALEPLSGFFTSVNVTTVSDQQALVNDIQQNARNLSFGGLFFDAAGNNSLIAFQALDILNAPTLLNLASNTWIASATSGGGAVPVIAANIMPFDARSGAGLDPMKWVWNCDSYYFTLILM